VSSVDLTLGTAMLGIAAGYYALGVGIAQSALDDGVGPRGLPRTYAIALAVLAIVLLAQAAFTRTRRAQRSAGRGRETHARWRVVGMVLIGVLYVSVVPWLGYLLSIGLLIAGTAWYQGGTMNRRVAIVAASGAVFLWLLFVAFLGIPQPSGAWASIF
jgi:hypothetical protein